MLLEEEKIHLILKLLEGNVQKSAELHEMTSFTFIETPQIGSFGLSFHTSPPLSPLPFAERASS